MIGDRRFSGDDSAQAAWRRWLVTIAVDTSNGFRPSTIRAWSISQLSSHVAKLADPRNPDIIEQVVLEHHGPERLAVVQAPLLHRLGIANDKGVVDADALDGLSNLSPDDICRAAIESWRESPSRDMALYLLALAIVFPGRWEHLHAILPVIGEELLGELEEGGYFGPSLATSALSAAEECVTVGIRHVPERSSASIANHSEAQLPTAPREVVQDVDNVHVDVNEAEDVSAVPRSRRRVVPSEKVGLSPLDEEIIFRIADSLQGVAGAPDESVLDALIDELIRLNGSRHQSFYHAGFHDAARQRPARSHLPAQNVHRWRWYYAGYIAGLARRGDNDAIVSLFDRLAEVRSLGDTSEGPSRYAIVFLARALQATERLADVVSFASVPAIAITPQLADMLLEIGTTLQRGQREAEAALVFERILQAERTGNALSPSFWSTVKRRHAHCLRAEGKLEAARRLLDEALVGANAEEQAMVLVDLGLIEAGFGRLSDLRLPSSELIAREMAAKLDGAEMAWQAADELGVVTSSHAHYVLGMRSLLRKRYAEAEQFLSRAVSHFDLERERYGPAQLLRRAHLHEAIARCANVDSDASRLEQAVAAIAEALANQEDVPDLYAQDVIAALSLRKGVLADSLVEPLLETGREALLDSLRGEMESRTSAVVANALAKRFRRPHRTLGERLGDGISLVERLLIQGRYDEATHVMDELEDLAVQSDEGERYLHFVEEASPKLSAIWEPHEIESSKIRVLESLARAEDAAQLLRKSYSRALARGDAQGILDAQDIVDALESYGCVPADEVIGLRNRIDRKAEPLDPLPAPTRSIRVLVVGGNEMQAQYDAAIRAHYSATAPHVTIDFMHTGWSSNWGEKVDEFKRRLPNADAVVLIYLMRTEFGRSVRKCMNGVPWRGCGGKGRDSVQRAISAAVAAVK